VFIGGWGFSVATLTEALRARQPDRKRTAKFKNEIWVRAFNFSVCTSAGIQ
jgi:hypothetical protein